MSKCMGSIPYPTTDPSFLLMQTLGGKGAMAQETGFLPLMKKTIVFLVSPATVDIWDVNQLMRVCVLSLSLSFFVLLPSLSIE